MNEERVPRKMLEWCPHGRRKVRARNSWMQKVTTGIIEGEINNMDRQRKMKKENTERRANID